MEVIRETSLGPDLVGSEKKPLLLAGACSQPQTRRHCFCFAPSEFLQC